MFYVIEKTSGNVVMSSDNQAICDSQASINSAVEVVEIADGPVFDMLKRIRNGVLEEIPLEGDELEAEVRAKRNDFLSATDWWATSDRTMTAEQTAYRQALRDITTHANWPNLADSDWPTKP